MIAHLLFVLALAPVQASARLTEDQAIEAARRALVRQIDPMLPREPFETWLRDLVGPRPTMKWEVNDCGEQSGSPNVDQKRDVPMCAQVQVSLPDSRELYVLLAVGTFRRGVIGTPRYFYGYLVEPGGPPRPIRSLAHVATLLHTPDKPDFSGQWVLVGSPDPASDQAVALTIRQSIVRTTGRGAPMKPVFRDLAVEREFKSGVRSDTYRIGLVGGIVPGTADSRRNQTRSSVTWDGDKLVIETGSFPWPPFESGPYAEHREVWEFDARGRLVITATDRHSGARPRMSTLTYRRK